jgi:hypothetical protein
MAKVVFELTEGEALDVRMALNTVAMQWGENARAARLAGNAQEAESCGRIAASYGELWERLAAAQFHAASAWPLVRATDALNTFDNLGEADKAALRRRFPTLAKAEGAAWRREHGE